ncbi:hypothetical protein G6O69_02880 [Pseudenhygromyxa sp. WMMC2535]|uniref:hypothetical protein n=1 Tax=Pseudenhygromyxa sp. WMMC2535 TaxID=2712867 RepID=UPI001553CC26|nr:hypothetical protein [Pseudenhygromyxa sp. WMMC2535]NVB36761.1 hypothetical protein [Pseudenhygromyxa sp. WMMC2535]
MEALVAPLERVVEAGEWFVRTPSLRVLYIVTSKVLRLAVLEHLAASELLEPNDCPFFVLEAPMEAGDDGWSLRCEELRADWAALTTAAAKADRHLDPLWPEHAASTDLERFCFELHSALGSCEPTIAGLVLVLAPVWVLDSERWRRDLTALLELPQLRQLRFVIVESELTAGIAVAEALGAAAEIVDTRVDFRALGHEMRARIETMGSIIPGTTGYRLTGGAGPSVLPPPRKGEPPAPSPEQRAEQAAALGISPALLDVEAMHGLQVSILGASAAMAEGDVQRAIESQRRARDFCVTNGLEREAAVSELILGSYSLQSGSTDDAETSFVHARERAVAASLPELAVLAQLSVGSCLLVQRRVDEAIVAYAKAGELGAELGAVMLTIEAQRMCGQLLLSKGRPADAASAFAQALAAADRAGDAAKGSSALAAARALAGLCREHGLIEQAESLEAMIADTGSEPA